MDDAEFVARVTGLTAPMMALARRGLDRAQDAEDVLQTALAAAYAARERYDPARPFRAWIAGFVIGALRNHVRSERRRPPRPPDSAFAFERLEAEWAYERLLEDPDAAMQRCSDGLYRAIGTLGSGEREVLLLRALLDLDYKEIARTCGVPAGTVMSRLHRARAAVRLALADTAVTR